MKTDQFKWPDPLLYRQQLPVRLRRDFEWGFIDRDELWRRLALLWGPDAVADFIATQGLAAA